MKKLNTAKTLFGFLGLATFASLVGTVSGTLAWYSYTTRVTVSYSGTSIENTVQLQIGIASETKMPHVNGDADNEEFWTTMTETTFEECRGGLGSSPIASRILPRRISRSL